MPKMKTRKAISERFKIKVKKKKGKKTMKIVKQNDGKGHFNGRETGKVRRLKRTDNQTTTHKKAITQGIPYAA